MIDVALRPGSDAVVIAWLVREMLADGAHKEELETYTDPADVRELRTALTPFNLSAVAARADLDPEVLVELLTAIRPELPDI